MADVKITVVKRMTNADLIAKYGKDTVPLCEKMPEGKEFISKGFAMPEGFCHWAWADIQRDVVVIATGGSFPWVSKDGVAISCCTDGFRPVIFLLERQ